VRHLHGRAFFHWGRPIARGHASSVAGYLAFLVAVARQTEMSVVYIGRSIESVLWVVESVCVCVCVRVWVWVSLIMLLLGWHPTVSTP
jgi:hypothetical protein